MAKETPLIPVEDARESALFFVVCALCFLAALAALSAKSTYGAAASWTAAVEGELTVSLPGVDRRAAEEAREIIIAVPGVYEARLITKEEIDALLTLFPDKQIAFFAQLGLQAMRENISEYLQESQHVPFFELPFDSIADAIVAQKSGAAFETLAAAGKEMARVEAQKTYLKPLSSHNTTKE